MSKIVGIRFDILYPMKNLIYILLITSTFGSFTVTGTYGNQTNVHPIEHCISDFQNKSINNIITGEAIRPYTLINLIIKNDLFGSSNSGTLIPEVSSPEDRIQIHIKEVKKMVKFPKMSNSELKKSRMEYYATKRKVDSLENKVADYTKIIETGKRQKVKVDKETREKIIVIEKLTDVQIKDMKRKLAAEKFQLMVATDELKEKDFGFSQATGAISNKISNSRDAYKQKKANEKIESVKALVNSAVLNGNLQGVVDVQNLAANGGDIKQIKSELMKIVRKENKYGYPIKNLSFKTVEIIMAGLLKWNTAVSDLPFDIS